MKTNMAIGKSKKKHIVDEDVVVGYDELDQEFLGAIKDSEQDDYEDEEDRERE